MRSAARTPTSCTIVPPYLLRRIADLDDDVGDLARQTLASDAGLRTTRATRPTDLDVPRRPGVDRLVSDAGNRSELPGEPARREGDAPTGDPAVDEAYDGLGATYALFADVFGRDSIDGVGCRLDATVHYERGYDNAFWDGTQMVFGDGDGRLFDRFTRPLTIVGHELAHGVLQFTANLTYEGPSGALNESVSDVFGVLVEQHRLGQSAAEATWLVGAGLFLPGVQGRALRSMREPGTAYDDPVLGRDPQPGHLRDYVVTEEDNGGVHINSGIPNRAFATAAVALGGPAWERAGWVWYDTVTDPRLAADAGFASFAALTAECAARRFGSGSDVEWAVRAGWEEVGLDAGGPAGRR